MGFVRVTPVLTICVLFWAMVLTSVTTIAVQPSLRTILKSHWKPALVLLFATIIWRIPADGTFFHGLEYENSYIYTVAGRELADHSAVPSPSSKAPYAIVVCGDGSLKSCKEWISFPEHFLGYPYVISAFIRVFGYSPAVGSLVNLVASLLSVLLIFSITLSITEDSVSAILAGLTFAVVPVFATYGLETSAEPFSGFCILLTLWLYLKLCSSVHESAVIRALTWGAYSSALLFAQTVKREDILLAVLLPIMLPFVLSPRSFERPLIRSVEVWLVILTSVIGVILSFKMHLLHTSESERELLLLFPFTASRVASFMATFFASFLVLPWYGGSAAAVVLGIGLALTKKGRALLPVSLLVAFMLLYSAHIRGYYEMLSGLTSNDSALRFSMNFMGLWAITCGLGLGAVVNRHRRTGLWQQRQRALIWAMTAVAFGILIVNFSLSIRLRRAKVEDEAVSRIAQQRTPLTPRPVAKNRPRTSSQWSR